MKLHHRKAQRLEMQEPGDGKPHLAEGSLISPHPFGDSSVGDPVPVDLGPSSGDRESSSMEQPYQLKTRGRGRKQRQGIPFPVKSPH